ncbi:MbtH family protein [Streptomyces sp. AC154]|uniref:MbtH family protein n=1 Tax=Streptomyces sp. AC154 TaxID=3143184 RepID=UPI003F7F7627
MTNPFDDQDGTFLVLVNHEGQHSLWPSFKEVPDGWAVSLGESPRETALAFVEENWTDMRPSSLRQATAGDAS